ncbi:MAG: cation:proton antiporter [Candidatus Dormibacteraeota bacterium]|nr:cation:proton antiporter [Candidatus Dormibacteraeota bacterium]
MFATLTVLVLAGLAGPLIGIGRRGLEPVVVGELAGGIILGRTGFGLIDAAQQPLPVFSALGFAMLMFTAGTHVDIGSPAIRQGFRHGLLTFAVTAALAVPAGLGIAALLGGTVPALLVVLIAGSSAAIAFPIIDEHGLSGPAVARLLAWVAVADSLTVIVMPLTLSASRNVGLAIGGDAAIVAAAALVLLAAARLRHLAAQRRLVEESRNRGWAYQVRLTLVLLLGLSAIAERTGASTLVAGFAAGVVAARLREPGRLVVQFTGVANGFFVPLFFVLLGDELNLRALVTEPSRIVLAVLLALAAVLTHTIAAVLTGRRHAVPIGLAASAQLGLPAAAASLGLATGAMDAATAAAVVAAGVLTLAPATVGALLLARGEPSPASDGDHGGASQPGP